MWGGIQWWVWYLIVGLILHFAFRVIKRTPNDSDDVLFSVYLITSWPILICVYLYFCAESVVLKVILKILKFMVKK